MARGVNSLHGQNRLSGLAGYASLASCVCLQSKFYFQKSKILPMPHVYWEIQLAAAPFPIPYPLSPEF